MSDKNGKINFFIDPGQPGSLLMSAFNERITGGKIQVESVSLSSFIKKHKLDVIDFMKLDVEGSETKVMDDLVKQKLLPRFKKMVIEYHHLIEGHPSRLGDFLLPLEKAGFDYSVNTHSVPVTKENQFQDILLYLYRPQK